jgi:phage terminase large subunit
MNQYKPQYLQRQVEALMHLATDSPVEQVLYGGGAGGGKTRFGCMWQIQRRLKYAGTRSLIGRSKLDTLKKTTLNTFFETCADFGLLADKHYTYNGQTNVITFFNGSEIVLKDLFAYPSNPNFDSLGSLEITDYFIDEVAEVTEKAVNIVHSRCRYKLNEFNLIPKGFLSCNPSKGWLYNEFYLKYRNNELPVHRAFVQALPTDNPHLPHAYIESLRRLPEYDRKRLLEGNWEFDDDSDKLFATDNLLRMFRNELLDGTKYITSDIARFGKDRTIICVWNGLTLIDLKMLHKASIDEVVNEIRNTAKQHNVLLQNVVCDEDGVGGGVVDYLKCRGFVNGSKAKQPQYQNLKSECYYTLAQYIEENKLTILVNDKKEQIVRELEMIKRHRADVDGKLQVTPKDQIKLREGISPDIADAIMMRMFFELNKSYGQYYVG